MIVVAIAARYGGHYFFEPLAASVVARLHIARRNGLLDEIQLVRTLFSDAYATSLPSFFSLSLCRGYIYQSPGLINHFFFGKNQECQHEAGRQHLPSYWTGLLGSGPLHSRDDHFFCDSRLRGGEASQQT